MTLSHSAIPGLALDRAPPAACPPFRSIRGRPAPQGDLPVEHWGTARFAVKVPVASPHQGG